MMKKVIIDDYDEINCPYCEQLVYDGNGKIFPCPHTVYMASDDGFEYLADNISLEKDEYSCTPYIDAMTDALTAKSDGESVKYISQGELYGYTGFENLKGQ